MTEQNKEQQAPAASEIAEETLEQVAGGNIIDVGCILFPTDPTDPPPFY